MSNQSIFPKRKTFWRCFWPDFDDKEPAKAKHNLIRLDAGCLWLLCVKCNLKTANQTNKQHTQLANLAVRSGFIEIVTSNNNRWSSHIYEIKRRLDYGVRNRSIFKIFEDKITPIWHQNDTALTERYKRCFCLPQNKQLGCSWSSQIFAESVGAAQSCCLLAWSQRDFFKWFDKMRLFWCNF